MFIFQRVSNFYMLLVLCAVELGNENIHVFIISLILNSCIRSSYLLGQPLKTSSILVRMSLVLQSLVLNHIADTSD